MSILFAGTPEIAVPTLEALANNFQIAAVLTNPDKKKGRGKKLQASPIKEKALEFKIPVLQYEKFDDQALKEISSYKADILFVFAYGKIFKQKFLDLFPKAALNVHPSLLPEFRGPSPLSAAILAGKKESGISIQKMALRMDSGDILLQQKFPLNEGESLGELEKRVSKLSAPLALDCLNNLENYLQKASLQAENQATYCSLIKKDEAWINWEEKGQEIARKTLAYDPWPAAKTLWKDKQLSLYKAKVLEETRETKESPSGTVLGLDKSQGFLIQTTDSILAVKELQLQGKNRLDYKAFANGMRDFTGSRLGLISGGKSV